MLTASFAPLLVTLQMDAESFVFFNAQRKRYFPEHRNHIDAHITLFHHLPGAEEDAITAVLDEKAHASKIFSMQANSIWMLGQGVAYTLASAEAVALRQALAQVWTSWLTPQDRTRGFKPHVTVQNKVTPQEAKALAETLSQSFMPFAVQAIGLQLWRYLGGKWAHCRDFPFTLEPIK